MSNMSTASFHNVDAYALLHWIHQYSRLPEIIYARYPQNHGDGIVPYHENGIIPWRWDHTIPWEWNHTMEMGSYHGGGIIPYHGHGIIPLVRLYIGKIILMTCRLQNRN